MRIGLKRTIDGKEYAVNRTDAISFIGGSQVNNEECYALIKMTRDCRCRIYG